MQMTYEEAKEIVFSEPCSQRFVCDNCPIGKVAHRENVICEDIEYSAYRIIRDYLEERSPYDEADTDDNSDNVNHPAHYAQGGIECIDAIEAATAGLSGIDAVCTANAIKYLWRWKFKNGAEDLRKAKWYIDHMLKGTHT